MSLESLKPNQAAQAFAEQIDDINRRSRLNGPADPDRLRQILADHEAACVAIEKAEAEAARDEDDRQRLSS